MCMKKKKIEPERITAGDSDNTDDNKNTCPKGDGKPPNVNFKQKYNFRLLKSNTYDYMKSLDIGDGNLEKIIEAVTDGLVGTDKEKNAKEAPYSIVTLHNYVVNLLVHDRSLEFTISIL